jgi:TolA-binding protein
MDCERFDRIVLDFLYDELDELTAAAARRHIEHCSRCRGIVAGLRATREVGALPLVDPPEGLELRILEAEQQVRGHLSIRQRAGRTISVLAGYAMRPQLAMAALLLLAIGGGLFMFRQRPNDRDTVSVTERGVAESDPEPATVLPKAAPEPSAVARAAAPAAVSPSGTRDDSQAAAPRPAVAGGSETRDGEDSVFHAALGAYRAGRFKEARQQFESVVAQGGRDAPQAAYYAAQSAKSAEGCGVGAPLFDQVSQRYPGTRAGYDGTWEAASCYQAIGDTEKARRAYQALLDEPIYGTRARNALAELDRIEDPQAYAARKSAPAKKAKANPDADAGTENSAPEATASAPSQLPAAPRQMPEGLPPTPALPPAE